MKYAVSGCRGITLVELLVALAMGSMLVAAVYTVYLNQIRGQAVQEATLDLQQGFRAALLIMKDEIRSAGADPTGRAGAEILTAKPDALHFTRDVIHVSGSGRFDGETTGPKEDIRYAVNSNGALGRETCRPKKGGAKTCSGLQAMVNHVDLLEFLYLDETGGRLTPVELQTRAGRNRIRQVQMTIVARLANSGRGLLSRYTDRRIYTNQFGEPLMEKPFTDNNRRLLLTTTIALRNP
ncbi:MAG: prepilin-type N-terminal cleavage/methylation domain-containing protein [Desulfosalsimonadaceae bacterium]